VPSSHLSILNGILAAKVISSELASGQGSKLLQELVRNLIVVTEGDGTDGDVLKEFDVVHHHFWWLKR
jgi:Mg2+/Co2+ transporter CorC